MKIKTTKTPEEMRAIWEAGILESHPAYYGGCRMEFKGSHCAVGALDPDLAKAYKSAPYTQIYNWGARIKDIFPGTDVDATYLLLAELQGIHDKWVVEGLAHQDWPRRRKHIISELVQLFEERTEYIQP